jgi:3,4-dihydroxy 2-butanone 4-phosphate synthase/GTP cyclohydrolase II
MAKPQEELWLVTFGEMVSPPEAIIEEARNGRLFILVDDEGRENEGDLVIPAQMATPEAINFMAKFGRGLICLALTRERIEELDLPLMARHNEPRHETAFTVSIEARDGVTTGISASDRARTVATAIDPTKGAPDIVTPGHVFPLVARDGGVLVRTGHTEAAVDLARLAGLNPSGVVCEIMNDDGTMARRDDLIAVAQRHGLKIATIADLIAYRRRHDSLVTRAFQASLESRFGGSFNMAIYTSEVSAAEHVALWKGDLAAEGPVLVRMHALNVLDDVLGDSRTTKGRELHQAMAMIGEAGRGVVVLLREADMSSLLNQVRARLGEVAEKGPSDLKDSSDLKDYGVGAQILLDLGVRDMVLLTNAKRTIVGLEGYGLTVVDRHPIPVTGAEED